MRSPAFKLLLVVSVVIGCGALGGASDGNCQPEPETVICDGDLDCPSGQICNMFQRCVDAFVTIDLDRDWYTPGQRVGFTVDPNGLDIEVGSVGGAPSWTIEHWSDSQDRWVPLRVGTLFGCRTTSCVDGRAVQLCVDPGPPWCMEHDAPLTDSWDGMHWVATTVSCGGSNLVVEYREPAPVGNYRVVYRYGYDARPGVTSPTGNCAAQTESVIAFFGIR